MPFASARRVLAATALTTTLILAGLAGPVFADYPVVPAFLSMCPGATGTGSFPIEARRADFNPPNFQNGETVTFTLSGSPSVNVGSGTATITDGDLTLPADWTSNPFGVYAPDKGAMTISYTAPSDATSSTFVFMEVYLNASGNMGYDSFSEPEFVEVFIEDCAPPPTPTPTPSPSPSPSPSPTPSASPSATPSASPSAAPSASPSTAPSSGPVTIDVSDPTTVVGQNVTVSGHGAKAGSTVDLWLHSTPVHIGSSVAAGDGTYTALVTIPTGTVAGAHTISATGTDPSDEAFSVDSAITVSDATPPATAAIAGQSPNDGSAPMVVLFAILGLAAISGLAISVAMDRRRRTSVR
jgi:hypothetical protein